MFVIKKTIDLAKFGWEGCSLIFQSLSYDELQELQKTYTNADPSDPNTTEGVMGFLKSKFVAGTAKDEKDKTIEVAKDDLGKFPYEIIEEVVNVLTGANPDPKG